MTSPVPFFSKNFCHRSFFACNCFVPKHKNKYGRLEVPPHVKKFLPKCIANRTLNHIFFFEKKLQKRSFWGIFCLKIPEL